MEWQMPPHGGKYKLVATQKVNQDIKLIMLIDQEDGEETERKEILLWGNINHLQDEELKSYLLSLSEGIEKGIYDVELIDKEIGPPY